MTLSRHFLIAGASPPHSAGCATVRTEVASAPGGEGVEYALPTSEFVLEIKEADGEVVATLSGPYVAADNAAKYRSTLLASAVSTNDFTIVVNEHGLLSSFAGSSEGKLTDIAVALAKTIAYQAGGQQAAEPFFNRHFRLGEMAAAKLAANQALKAHIESVCRLTAEKGKPSQRCKTLQDLVIAAASGGLIEIEGTDYYSNANAASQTAACNGGKCPSGKANVLYYRPLKSVRIAVKMGNGNESSGIFTIPDESRTNWVRVSGGVFAKQEYTYTFADGVLTNYHRIARNEVEGLVTLPLAVAKAIVAAPVEALNDRKNTVQAQTEYLKQVKALADASADAKKACEDAPAACQKLPVQSIQLSTIPKTIKQTDQSPTGSNNPGGANNDGGQPDSGGGNGNT